MEGGPTSSFVSRDRLMLEGSDRLFDVKRHRKKIDINHWRIHFCGAFSR
jgi:hypothetical protein